MSVNLRVDGVDVEVRRDDVSLLSALRDELGIRGPKDGCSPQGQCGCCTVLVDGAPRVACVTAVRRVAGRKVTTVAGLAPDVVEPLVAALVAAGGSQCGFCTPGILCRLAPLGPRPDPAKVESALLAHLCRCTGWRSILDAVVDPPGGASAGARGGVTSGGASAGAQGGMGSGSASAEAGRAEDAARVVGGRDLDAAGWRATIEGRAPQRVGTDVAMGRGGFADDGAPLDSLVAVPDGSGGWATGETVEAARAAAGKVQGRRSGRDLTWPLEVPDGEWAVRLQTTWIEPAYLEPDASWCRPGGVPATPLGNGGAFGGKAVSPWPAAARSLADEHGRPVRVLLTREDVVRLGPKRPPVAAGVRVDGTGELRVAATPGIADAIGAIGPGLVVHEVEVDGPPTSSGLRAAGWAEAAALLAAVVAVRDGAVGVPDVASTGRAQVGSPEGSRARAEVDVDAAGLPVAVRVTLECGDPIDLIVLRSYATGAAHMGLGWVLSEAVAVDDSGVPEDLTIRSWGILRARDTPPIEVRVDATGGPACNGSDAVFAAVAAATWIAQGLPPRWPTRRGAWA